MRDPENPRSFGVSVGLVCSVVAVVHAWRGRPAWAFVFGIGGGLLLGAALLAPAALALPSRVWWRLARALAWVNTRVLLSALFVLVFTPIAIVFRLIGRDHLGRRPRAGASGWVPSPDRLREPTHYRHMY